MRRGTGARAHPLRTALGLRATRPPDKSSHAPDQRHGIRSAGMPGPGIGAGRTACADPRRLAAEQAVGAASSRAALHVEGVPRCRDQSTRLARQFVALGHDAAAGADRREARPPTGVPADLSLTKQACIPGAHRPRCGATSPRPPPTAVLLLLHRQRPDRGPAADPDGARRPSLFAAAASETRAHTHRFADVRRQRCAASARPAACASSAR